MYVTEDEVHFLIYEVNMSNLFYPELFVLLIYIQILHRKHCSGNCEKVPFQEQTFIIEIKAGYMVDYRTFYVKMNRITKRWTCFNLYCILWNFIALCQINWAFSRDSGVKHFIYVIILWHFYALYQVNESINTLFFLHKLQI